MAGKGGSKEISKGSLAGGGAKGGGKGFVGKQGGAPKAVSGRVSIPGHKSGGGKWAKGGGTGYVGKQGTSNRVSPGKVSVPRGR